MDFLIAIMAAFAALGLVDDLIGNRMGLGEDFSQGLASMGRLALSMVGFYCIGISFIQDNAEGIAAMTAGLPFDPSMITSCILCADVGGLPIAQHLAEDPLVGIYTGALIGGGLGMTIGFQMPIFLSALDKKYLPILMRGFIYGIITLPLGLMAGGILLGLDSGKWLANTVPVLILCAVMILAFLTVPDRTVGVLTGVGTLVRVVSYALFALVLLGVFLPKFSLADSALVEEIMFLVFRTTIVASGGLVIAKLAIRYCGGPLNAVARILGTNSEAVIGMLLSCFQSMAMIPLFPRMDRRGKIMNAAFSVCGAFVLGGQMAFVSQMIPSNTMPSYMVNKLVCGAAAVALACLMERKNLEQEQAET